MVGILEQIRNESSNKPCMQQLGFVADKVQKVGLLQSQLNNSQDDPVPKLTILICR